MSCEGLGSHLSGSFFCILRVSPALSRSVDTQAALVVDVVPHEAARAAVVAVRQAAGAVERPAVVDVVVDAAARGAAAR